ncbi:MAG: hypothetical protein IKB71_05065 [Lentisphaeria bacterium]|nr:hypothetical protein [Lentisphaeria bacterium]
MGKTLTELYNDKERFMITAHRGASFEFPENTLLSMQKAYEAGADMIEFDLRGTADGIPVLLHDTTIDRTSHGHGEPESYTLAELKKLNFSYFLQRYEREAPACEKMEIPTFEEILAEFHDKIPMNIQVYAKSEKVLREICRLYKKYDMYDRGYFTIYPESIEAVKAIDPDIELCTTIGWIERTYPENIRICREKYNCRFIQPVKEYITEDTLKLMADIGLRSNVYYSDDPAEIAILKKMGAMGILTNKAHLMCKHR